MLSKIKSYFKKIPPLKKSEILGWLNFFFFGMPLLYLIIASSYFIIIDYMVEDNKYDIPKKPINLSYQIEGKDIRKIDEDFLNYEITYEEYKKIGFSLLRKNSEEFKNQVESEIKDARENHLVNKMINNSRFFAKELNEEYHLIATDKFLNVSEYSLYLKNKTIEDYNSYINNYKEKEINYEYQYKFINEDRLFYKYGSSSELNLNKGSKFSMFQIEFSDFCIVCDIENDSKITKTKEYLNFAKTSMKKYLKKETLEYKFTYNVPFMKSENEDILSIKYSNGQLLSYTFSRETIYPLLDEELKIKQELKDTVKEEAFYFSFILLAYIFFANVTNRLKRKEEKEEILKEKEEEITKKIEKKYREKDKEIKIEKEKILKI